jgi:hypothetical protein
MKSKLNFLAIIVTTFLLFPSCMHYNRHNHNDSRTESEEFDTSSNNSTNDSKYKYETRALKLEKTEKAKMDISIPVGFFKLQGGSENLLEGKFKYRRNERKLEVSNEINSKDEADVVVSMEKTGDFNINNEKAVTNISINSSVPTDLELSFGAGEGKFDFTNTKLEKAKFDLGAGDFDINLRQTSLAKLEVNAGVGKGHFDLSGDWKQDLRAEFSCGVGELIILLPSNTSVRVEVNGALGDVDHHGLDKDGQTYTNRVYKKTNHKLDITINGGIGRVELRVQE